MSTTWPVYLVGHDYSHMKFRKFNQSNLQQPSTTVFDDDDTTNFNRLMVYLLFRTNIRMSKHLLRTNIRMSKHLLPSLHIPNRFLSFAIQFW